VRDGLARVSARIPLSRLADLKREEANAQSFRRGMWGQPPQIPSAGPVTGYTRRLERKNPAAASPRKPRASAAKPTAKAKRTRGSDSR